MEQSNFAKVATFAKSCALTLWKVRTFAERGNPMWSKVRTFAERGALTCRKLPTFAIPKIYIAARNSASDPPSNSPLRGGDLRGVPSGSPEGGIRRRTSCWVRL